MNLITKSYEKNVGFTSVTDDELFSVNGGSFSDAKEIFINIVQGIGDFVVGVKDFLVTTGQAFVDAGPGTPQQPDTSTKNPNHPSNQPHC